MTSAGRRRVLFLTPILPGTGFWGVHQRHWLLGRVIGGFADIDALVFLRGDSAVDLAAAEAEACEEWGATVRLHICRADSVSASLWRRWLMSPVDFRRQPALQIAGGATQMAAIKERLATDRPDYIVAFGIEMMLPLLAMPGPLPPIDLDFDNVPHLRMWRESRIARSPIHRVLFLSQVPGLLWAERRMTSAARRSFVCSKLDQDYLTRRWLLPRIEVVPNAVAIPKPVPTTAERSLLFIGQLEYPPNTEAARFLIDRIWPRVLAKLPEARLRIAGPSSEVLQRGRSELPKGVDLTGAVDDLRQLYARTQVACAPLHAGSGTRVKILEAAAFGRPVVATRIGAEGLDFTDEQGILIRDTPRSFAEACCRLLLNLDESRRLGEAARKRVTELYSTSVVLDRLRGLLES